MEFLPAFRVFPVHGPSIWYQSSVQVQVIEGECVEGGAEPETEAEAGLLSQKASAPGSGAAATAATATSSRTGTKDKQW